MLIVGRIMISRIKKDWITAALHDACTRAEQHWQVATQFETKAAHGDAILHWAKFHKLQQVVTLRPEVGPLNDSLPTLRASLADAGIRLILIDRPEDLQIRAFATDGFFNFGSVCKKAVRNADCECLIETTTILDRFPP